ncbi:MAG: uncharacterized protein JWM86_1911 [Thermoleophilia bacterium]|nr:uncharacterized protein [Thermoleophilia bacterium]
MLLVAVAIGAAGCSRGADAGDDPASKRERRAAAPATLEVATFSSIARLTPASDLASPIAGDAIDLEAARGEREGGQLIARALRGTPRVVLEPAALRSADGARIPARRVHAYLEQELVVRQGSPNGRSGTYVDPLVPARRRPVELGGDRRLIAWIDVDVPLDARPGTYSGSVAIRRARASGRATGGADGILARVPVRLVVRDATIPKLPTLHSHVGLDQSQLVRFEGVRAGTPELRDVTERYATELAHARLSVGDVGALPPGSMPDVATDPEEAAYLRRVFTRRGVSSVRIPFYVTYPFRDPLGADRPAAIAYLRAAMAWARSIGVADRAYVFAFDEPSDADAGAVRELHELLREADPELRQLVTREASARPFAGSVDIWAPNIKADRFQVADVVRERRAGRPTWWYPSITSWQPYPTLFIDDPRPAPRALGWLAFERGVTGILYWSATHWHEVEDPYEDPATYHEPEVVGNGDGTLMYPGGLVGLPGTPVPSVRLLQLRDGIEDHDLLAMARCAATPAELAGIRRAVHAAAPAMDRIEPSPAQVNALRSAAFSAIEARSPRPGCALTQG